MSLNPVFWMFGLFSHPGQLAPQARRPSRGSETARLSQPAKAQSADALATASTGSTRHDPALTLITSALTVAATPARAQPASLGERIDALQRTLLPVTTDPGNALVAGTGETEPDDSPGHSNADLLASSIQIEPQSATQTSNANDRQASAALAPAGQTTDLETPTAIAAEITGAAELLRSLVTPSLPETEATAVGALLDEAARLLAEMPVAVPTRSVSAKRGRPQLPLSSRLYQVQKVNRAKAQRPPAKSIARIGEGEASPQRARPVHSLARPKPASAKLAHPQRLIATNVARSQPAPISDAIAITALIEPALIKAAA